MTVSSTAKDNPKTSKKATKQPSAISSSLKSIMKHGGNVSALREGGSKKLSKGKTISRDTDAKKHADKKTIDDKMGDDDVDMDKKTEEMKKEKSSPQLRKERKPWSIFLRRPEDGTLPPTRPNQPVARKR
jgi:hypothetical protein